MTNEELLTITKTVLEGQAVATNQHTWDLIHCHGAGRHARREILVNGQSNVAHQMFEVYANSEVNKAAFLLTLGGGKWLG